jgi:GNAT superfamily N-acetyltransferase
MTQIDQFFTINHELKAYVYGAKKFPDDPIMHDQIMSACEMLADLFQQLVQLHKHGKLDPDNWLGWNRYMLSIYNSSDSFRHYLDVNGWWYTLDFVALFSAFPEDARDPGKVLIDRPTGGKLIGDTVLWAIYEEAFPADEKDPRDVIYATISKRKGAVIRAQCKDAHYNYKRTVGFAIVQPLLKPNLIRRLRVKFLIYLAVNRMVRGHGVGTQLLTEVTKWKLMIQDTQKAQLTAKSVNDALFSGKGWGFVFSNKTIGSHH